MKDRRRILVVDNDREMVGLLNHTLKTEGFDTTVVADVHSALTMLDEIEPDLVILDSVVSGSDGFQMLDLIREQSDIPVIMLTRKYDIESLQRALSLGADDYIRKPFSTRAFVARIRAKLRRTTHTVN